MNATLELREQYKQAARNVIRHINTGDFPQSINFFEGRLSGLDVALGCLGVTDDEIREMYKTCEEDLEVERELEADAGQPLVNIRAEVRNERDQEALDAAKRPVSQARAEAEQ